MFLFQATRPDMVRILSAALHVVLRRDMSLNRRLYAWLLGRYLMNMLIIDKKKKGLPYITILKLYEETKCLCVNEL